MYILASLLRKTEIQLRIIKMMYYGYCIILLLERKPLGALIIPQWSI